MISLREILMDDSRLYLVFEFVPMDLKKFIDSRPKKHLDEITTKSFTYQVIINYLYYEAIINEINTFKFLFCTVISCYILLPCETNFA